MFGESREVCNEYCQHLVCCKEEYDDDFLGFCCFEGRKLIGFMDDICSGKCDCIIPETDKKLEVTL